MIETVHVLVYEWRYAVAVIAVIGILYSLTLYTKAMFVLSAPSQRRARPNRTSRRRQALRGKQAVALGDPSEAAAPDASTVDWQDDDAPEAEADAGEEDASVPDDTDAVALAGPEPSSDSAAVATADQFNLLDSLPDDTVSGAPGDAAGESPEPEDDYDSRATERVSKSPQNTPSAKSGYGIDPNARTRHDLSGPKTDAYGVNEQTTVAIPAKGKAPGQSHDDSAAPAAPEHTHPNQVKTEAFATDTAPRQRGTGVDDLELLRRASRMEELGFHVGIIPARLRENPHAVSEEEKQALLSTLGQLEEHIDPYGPGTEPVTQENQGASAVGLDDILAKLDHALTDEFPQSAEGKLQALGEDPLAPHAGKDDAATTIIRSNEPPTTLHRTPSELINDAVEIENLDLEDEQAEAHQTEAETSSENESETSDEDSAGSSEDDRAATVVDDSNQDQAASPAPQADNVDEPDGEESASQPPAPAAEEDLTPPPSPPPRRKPGRIPDWARADTFDEDVPDDRKDDDDDGKQLDLFDKPQ